MIRQNTSQRRFKSWYQWQATFSSAKLEDRPGWLDLREYPFEPHYAYRPQGRMHYVDVGEGDPIVFVHGVPGWSWGFRYMLRYFSRYNRCIAPDLLGFGFSDKGKGIALTAEEHAASIEDFIEEMGLKNVTLVLHEWGGPIGLSYASKHPENVKRILLMNSFMWPLEDNEAIRNVPKMLAHPLNALSYKQFFKHFSALVESQFGDPKKLSLQTASQYYKPFEEQSSHRGLTTLSRQYTKASGFLSDLYARRGALLDKPMLLVWGGKDQRFDDEALKRWEAMLTNADVIRQPNIGHNVPEELGPDMIALTREFLRDTGILHFEIT